MLLISVFFIVKKIMYIEWFIFEDPWEKDLLQPTKQLVKSYNYYHYLANTLI
jgi:hypothetical protein